MADEPVKKTRKPFERTKRSQEFKDKIKGSGNYAWKGDKATVRSIHCWVMDNFVHPETGCENCGSTGRLDWSNKDHKYSRDRNDWQSLCRSCHIRYDKKHNGYKQKP